MVPSHRFVRNSPTPGDPYRCTHPQCAEDWRPGQSQPTSRCPADTSTADILQQQAEQEARLEALNGESEDGEGGSEDEVRPDSGSEGAEGGTGHQALLRSLGSLVDAGAWQEEALLPSA